MTDPIVDLKVESLTIGSKKARAVSARALHEALQIPTSFTTWAKRKITTPLVLDADFTVVLTRKQGIPQLDYAITIANGMHIAMISRKPLGRTIATYLERFEVEPNEAVNQERRDGQPLFPTIRSATVSRETVLVVSLKELHATLRVETRFNDWRTRRLAEYRHIVPFRPDTYSKMSNDLDGTTVTSECVHLKDAKELAMIERTPTGQAIRSYFISCEEQLNAIAPDAAAVETARLRAELSAIHDRPKVGDGAVRGTAELPAETMLPLSFVRELLADGRRTMQDLRKRVRSLEDRVDDQKTRNPQAARQTRPDAPPNTAPTHRAEDTDAQVGRTQPTPPMPPSPSPAATVQAQTQCTPPQKPQQPATAPRPSGPVGLTRQPLSPRMVALNESRVTAKLRRAKMLRLGQEPPPKVKSKPRRQPPSAITLHFLDRQFVAAMARKTKH